MTISAREYQSQLQKWTRKSRRKAAFPSGLKASLISVRRSADATSQAYLSLADWDPAISNVRHGK